MWVRYFFIWQKNHFSGRFMFRLDVHTNTEKHIICSANLLFLYWKNLFFQTVYCYWDIAESECFIWRYNRYSLRENKRCWHLFSLAFIFVATRKAKQYIIMHWMWEVIECYLLGFNLLLDANTEKRWIVLYMKHKMICATPSSNIMETDFFRPSTGPKLLKISQWESIDAICALLSSSIITYFGR